MSTSTGCCCMKGAEALEDIRDIMLGGDAMGSIICYDWDGTTLGAVPVSRRATVDDVERLLGEFAAKHTAAEVDGFGYAEDAAKPLSNKAGYKFCGVWLWKESDAFECYLKDGAEYPNGAPIKHDSLSGYTAEERPSMEAILDRLATDGTAELKAAYEAQANLNTGTGSNRYTNTIIDYGRYGNAVGLSGCYYIMLKIQRRNSNGSPVARMRNPMLVYTQVAEGTTARMFSKKTLDYMDEQIVELEVDRRVAELSFYCLDTYGLPTWFTASPMSNAVSIKNRVDATAGTDGFIKEGTLRYVFEAAVNYSNNNEDITAKTAWTFYVDNNAFKDAGLTYEGKTVAQAKEALLAEVRSRVAAGNTTPMTAEEMQAAIDAAVV